MLSGKQRDEIPERVMRRRVLGIAAVGLHLDRMDEIGKLDRILDEENRDVVADEVEIALVRIEFDSKAAHVAGHISGPRAAGDGRETGKDFRFLSFLGEERRPRQMRNWIGHLKVAVRPRSAGVNDALRDSLVIEMGDLLPEREIFQKRRAPVPGFQRILIVRDDDALIGREGSLSRVSGLMRRASRSGDKVFLWIFEFLKAFRLACFCH